MTGYQAWMTAARPHTLPAAIVPVLVGSGLAWGDRVFRWDVLALTLTGALSIQIAANFANDVSDARRGADTVRLGPPRMVAMGAITPRRMWAATWIAVGVAVGAGIGLVSIAGPWVVVIGVISILAMLGYVGGPVPYGYRGLGEVFVFVFFGVVATVGSRFVHDGSAPVEAWLLSIPVGLLASAILVVNNYRDIDGDAAAGKRTLAVMIGRAATRRLFAATIYVAYVAVALFAVLSLTPRGTAAAVVVLPYAALPIRMVRSEVPPQELVQALKLTARAHLWTGVLLTVGAAV
ncbi:MAG: 1,4-dihydroxy-2-naphthoate polyprenyltransferase [Actinobacteria bacterium]|nr:1,4-dihydroxy-2-naphthoate polyprenyltransferase [Actinomycetota bacterium]